MLQARLQRQQRLEGATTCACNADDVAPSSCSRSSAAIKPALLLMTGGLAELGAVERPWSLSPDHCEGAAVTLTLSSLQA